MKDDKSTDSIVRTDFEDRTDKVTKEKMFTRAKEDLLSINKQLNLQKQPQIEDIDDQYKHLIEKKSISEDDVSKFLASLIIKSNLLNKKAPSYIFEGDLIAILTVVNYQLNNILLNDNITNNTKVDEIKDLLKQKLEQENKRKLSIDRETFTLLIKKGKVPRSLFLAPEFQKFKKDINAGLWNEGEERTITTTEIFETTLSPTLAALDKYFEDPKFVNILKKYIDLVSQFRDQ